MKKKESEIFKESNERQKTQQKVTALEKYGKTIYYNNFTVAFIFGWKILLLTESLWKWAFVAIEMNKIVVHIYNFLLYI